MFVTCTAPQHTSSISTLDPSNTPKKTKVKTNQQGREEKREEEEVGGTETNQQKNKKKDIIEFWQKTSDDGRLQNGHRHPDTWGFHRFIILETKLTMAEAGWSGSSSANRWLTLSVVLPCFLAMNPKSFTEPPPSLPHFLSWGSMSQ